MTWAQSNIMNRRQEEDSDTNEPQPPKQLKTASSSLFSAMRADTSSQSSSKTDSDELNLYASKRTFSSESNNPLDHWKILSADFPILSAVAKEILPTQATSAESERDFSKMGLTRLAKRSLLKAEKVNAIEVLNSAYAAGLISFH